MPRYDYACSECGKEKEVLHGMREKPEIKCEGCESTMIKTLAKSISFILKGANWSGKNIKEKDYRMKRNREMGKKMAKAYDIPDVQPNYNGQICKNWDEAKELATNAGVNTARYDKQVDTLKKEERKRKDKKEKLLKGEA